MFSIICFCAQDVIQHLKEKTYQIICVTPARSQLMRRHHLHATYLYRTAVVQITIRSLNCARQQHTGKYLLWITYKLN